MDDWGAARNRSASVAQLPRRAGRQGHALFSSAPAATERRKQPSATPARNPDRFDLSQLSTAPLRRDGVAPHETVIATARHDVEVGHATPYRPEIDGLRAIAVTSVLAYHADIAAVPGGYVGVDIFFVISGYLIMTTLAADMRRGRFSVVSFYERRIRRIFPALFVMGAFCLVAGALMFAPSDFQKLGQSLGAMALFSSNLLFCFDSEPTGYFAHASATQLLLHTWSLAVEEQFYIVMPIGLYLLRRRPARETTAWLAVLAALSFALSVVMVAHWRTGAFYLVFPRAWELLVGSLMALGMAPPLRHRFLREAEAALGVALLAWPIFLYARDTPFPGAAALPPCLGAWLIIHAVTAGPTLVGRWLAMRPMVWVGLISYSLYLWHWPIVVLVKYLNMGKLNAQTTIVIVVASFAMGVLSFRLVERPFRGRQALLKRRGLFVAGALAGGGAIVAGLTLTATAGLPQRFDARTLEMVRANVARETNNPNGSCENFRKDVRTIGDIALCPIEAGSPRKILFWGDSLIGAMQPLVGRLHGEGALGGRGALFTVSASCTPALRVNRSAQGYYCDAFTRLALQRARFADVDTVFIGFATAWATVDGTLCETTADGCRPLDRAEQRDMVLDDLLSITSTLRAAGKTVILSLPYPIYDLSVPQMQIDATILGRGYQRLRDLGLARTLRRNDYPELRARIGAIAKITGARIFDPLASLCAERACTYQRDGVSIYTDTIHVAVDAIGIYHDNLRAVLAAAH